MPTTHQKMCSRPCRGCTTSGGAFARCVLHVIRSVPEGKVASYGQVAALASAPRNARQVGAMLRVIIKVVPHGTASLVHLAVLVYHPPRGVVSNARSSRLKA